MIFNVILKDLIEMFFGVIFLLLSLPPRIRIRIHMNIFLVLDPDLDPHNNRCGSATLHISKDPFVILCAY